MVLFPVVMALDGAVEGLKGKQRVTFLSAAAREALRISARKAGLVLKDLPKDEHGVPCPVDGSYWSLSHKPSCVAAVVGEERVGIDVEEIKPRSQTLFDYVAGEEEWQLSKKCWQTLFRYWTAKEAALKAVGVGITGLKTCRIVSVLDDTHIVVNYKRDCFLVEQLIYKGHVVSIAKSGQEVRWILVENLPCDLVALTP